MLVRVLPGRQLRWSPAWGCSPHHVVFDATSGDFWVLGDDGRALLQWLDAEPRPVDKVWLRLQPAGDEGITQFMSLVQSGLVTGWNDGRPAALPQPRAAGGDRAP